MRRVICCGWIILDLLSATTRAQSIIRHIGPTQIPATQWLTDTQQRKVDIINGSSTRQTLQDATIKLGNVMGTDLSQGSAVAALIGAKARSETVRLADTINVKDFAAKGDGTTDDTAALNLAFSAARALLETQPVHIVFPPGRYLLSSAWNPAISAANDLAIVGAGAGATSLVFNGTDGFDISGTLKSVVVRGMALLTGYTGAQYAYTGLSITGPVSGKQFISPLLENLTFADKLNDFTNRQYGWATAINLVTTANADIHNVRVEMPDLTFASTTDGVALRLSGQGNNNGSGPFSTDTSITGLFGLGGYALVSVGPYVQGVYLVNSASVGQGYGVTWDGTTSGDAPMLLTIMNSEFADHNAGILTKSVTMFHLVGNQITHYAANSTDTFTPIDVEAGGYGSIVGNDVLGMSTGTIYPENGIVVNNNGGAPIGITGNSITFISGWGIWLKGTTAAASVSGNSVNGTTKSAAVQDDTGKNSVIGTAYNSNMAPIFDNGVNISIRTRLQFPVAGRSTAYIQPDGSGGLRMGGNVSVDNAQLSLGTGTGTTRIASDGSGNLSIGGSLAATTAQVRASTATGYTVATLPAAGSAARYQGARAFVTDATTCTFLGALTGGGSTFCPVIYNGTAWVAE